MRYGLIPAAFDTLDRLEILEFSNFFLSRLFKWKQENPKSNLTTNSIRNAIFETLSQYSPLLNLSEEIKENLDVSTWATCVFTAPTTRSRNDAQGVLTTLNCSKDNSMIAVAYADAEMTFHREIEIGRARAAVKTNFLAINPALLDLNTEVVLLNGFLFNLQLDKQNQVGEIDTDLKHFSNCEFSFDEKGRLCFELDVADYADGDDANELCTEYKLLLDAMISVGFLLGNLLRTNQLKVKRKEGKEWPTVRINEYDLHVLHDRKVPLPFALGMIPESLETFLNEMIRLENIAANDQRGIMGLFHTIRQIITALCNHGYSPATAGLEFDQAVEHYKRSDDVDDNSYICHIMPHEHNMWQINKILGHRIQEPRTVENRELIFQFS